MSGPTREQVLAWSSSAGMAGMVTDVVTTTDELAAFAALAYAAGQTAEREACRSIADDARKGASMSKYATSAECRAARDMAKKIEHLHPRRTGRQPTVPRQHGEARRKDARRHVDAEALPLCAVRKDADRGDRKARQAWFCLP